MWDVLSALIPPAVVAAVFCTAIYKLLRREMAPRTPEGPAADGGDATASDAGSVQVAPRRPDEPGGTFPKE